MLNFVRKVRRWLSANEKGDGRRDAALSRVSMNMHSATTPGGTVTLAWLLGLTGELEDGHPNSLRFRENIESPNIRLGELEAWLEEAVARRRELQYLYALQDLVVSLGRRLGFSVTYGSYEDGNPLLPFDGLWRIDTDLFATVSVFSEYIEALDLDELASQAATLKKNNPILNSAALVHLLVPCREYAASLPDEIRKGPLPLECRILPLETILELARLLTEGVLSAAQLPPLFRPFDAVGIHDTLLFVEEFIAAYEQPESGTQAAAAAAEEDTLPSLAQIRKELEDGNPEIGMELLQRYADLHPDDSEAWELLGDLLIQQDRLDEGLERYNAILARDHTRADVLSKLLLVLRRERRHAEAIEIIDFFISRQKSPLPDTLRLVRADFLLKLNRIQDALETLEGISDSGRDDEEFLHLMARCLERLDRVHEALELYERLLGMKPSDAALKRHVSQLRRTFDGQAAEEYEKERNSKMKEAMEEQGRKLS